ncbi:hypothetical protein [Kitasatospora purpeofusca]|uniref:hypothetical protein n=1 Tax=Kitasatospora purpeofusca TaxID=67352 RepID=UPI002A5AAF13|nr:hypothetical protein [Kitasatospora purpeofusca]MDY0811003.1 hypothetical protein [Kitasatospora purpeofusca]
MSSTAKANTSPWRRPQPNASEPPAWKRWRQTGDDGVDALRGPRNDRHLLDLRKDDGPGPARDGGDGTDGRVQYPVQDRPNQPMVDGSKPSSWNFRTHPWTVDGLKNRRFKCSRGQMM